MENINEQVVNEEVVEGAETIADQVENKIFPSDEMLKSMGVTREEFDKQVEEYSKLSHEEQMERLNKLQEKNEQLLNELEEMNKKAEHNNLIASLNAEGLSEFQGLFDLETTDEKVAFLKKVKNEILVANSYIPKDKATQDEYTQAIEQKDVNKALGFKFSRLFGGK